MPGDQQDRGRVAPIPIIWPMQSTWPLSVGKGSLDFVAALATNQKRTPFCYGLPRLVQPSGDLGDDLASAPAANQPSRPQRRRPLSSRESASEQRDPIQTNAQAAERRPFRAIRVLRPISTETRIRPKAGLSGGGAGECFSRRAGAAWRPWVWSKELPTWLGRSVAKIIVGRIRELSGERFARCSCRGAQVGAVCAGARGPG
jgi:hypothetical protein